MRYERWMLTVCVLSWMTACPGGGTTPRGDASGTDPRAEADGMAADAEADWTAAETETDAVLEDLPDSTRSDDQGVGRDIAYDTGDVSPDDATVFELPPQTCSTDEECEAAFGKSGECLRIFCDLSVRVCAVEPAPDGSPCTVATHCEEDGLCKAGECHGNPIVCDDENPCTDDTCDPAVGCVFTNNSAQCDDGNECTTNDHCDGGRCIGTPACGCTSDADCLPFEDGDLCNGRLRCEGATCVVDPATVIHCEPPAWKPCLSARCVPETGACESAPAPDGTACDDGNACTEQDRCANGECAGIPRVCEDHDPCTADSCDPKSGGCVFVPANDGKPCSDGNACTTADVCSGGTCAGKPVNCNDGNPCTDDACDPKTGACVYTPNTAPCDDQNACTLNDACSGGKCIGSPRVCDDVNSCTADSCDPAVGCVFVPANDGKTCSDGNLCTTGDVCSGGKCVGKPKNCDDQNPCTDDSCDKKTGACVHTPNTAPCDDHSVCTTGDACSGGICTGTPIVCNDHNECTTDTCDAQKGCVFTPVPNWPPVLCDGQFHVCWNGECVGLPGGP